MRKEARIKTTRDFKTVYSGGTSLASRDLVVYFLKGQGDTTRIGLSISKRIGSAVERNRIKRIIREIFRNNLNRIKSGYDIVVITRQPIKGKSFQQVEGAFIDILQRAGLLIDEEHCTSHD